MTPEQFLNRCKVICHVGPAGVWEHISKNGFRTAEQLVMEADLSDEERHELLTTPRRESVGLKVGAEDVVLRDQGPLFARKDLSSILDDGLEVSDWIHLLNQRVYFFTDQTAMQKFLDKYVEIDGSQDVIWLSPLKLLESAGLRLELSSQNVGAIARRRGALKTADAFAPLWRFTDRKPAEATILDGLDDLSPVFRAERCFKDGRREALT
ncbi:MAG TPA: hypothetical protein VG346_06165 [Acidimicrobiales bacterium]|jgi:hypothetical protein|nr:hypothetical protein [Acidimicrobiales bacterium]